MCPDVVQLEQSQRQRVTWKMLLLYILPRIAESVFYVLYDVGPANAVQRIV